MISPVLNYKYQGFTCQQKNKLKTQMSFASRATEPSNFKQAMSGIYTGGMITNQAELDYLINHRHVRTIISLLDGTATRNAILFRIGTIADEQKLINETNAKGNTSFVEFKSLPIWNALQNLRALWDRDRIKAKEKEQKLTAKLRDLIAISEKPIYLHCITGEVISHDAAYLIKGRPTITY